MLTRAEHCVAYLPYSPSLYRDDLPSYGVTGTTSSATYTLVGTNEGEARKVTYGPAVLRLLLHPDPQLRSEAQAILRSSLQGVDPRLVPLIVTSWIEDCIATVPTWLDAHQTLVCAALWRITISSFCPSLPRRACFRICVFSPLTSVPVTRQDSVCW